MLIHYELYGDRKGRYLYVNFEEPNTAALFERVTEIDGEGKTAEALR